MGKTTFGVIVGNRGCFPDSLAQKGRQDILAVLKEEGYGVVAPGLKDTKFGSVETYGEAKKCADIFQAHKADIDGIIVTLPNFGDEKGVLETVKRADLDVPILIQAEPDIPEKMTRANRRDSFCGKVSVCNNLSQGGIPYTLTKTHTVKIKSRAFKDDLDDFAAVCRIVGGLKNARFGAIGARPGLFNTVRYSEKILEHNGITVETLDLSEVIGRAGRLADSDSEVKRKLKAVKKYLIVGDVSKDVLGRMAKFGVVVDRWVKELDLGGTAIQCWTSIEEFYGIAPCTIMSMMSEAMVPSACEVDVTGLLGMYVLQLAGGGPSAILDWNNNYGDDPDKCVVFHCSNIAKSFLKSATMDIQAIMADNVGRENAIGTVAGRIKPAKATFCRATTDDVAGTISAYVGDGEFTNDKLSTFGGYGVVKIANLQRLMRYVCQGGFEHHVAFNMCRKSDAIAEALGNYMDWDVYRHV